MLSNLINKQTNHQHTAQLIAATTSLHVERKFKTFFLSTASTSEVSGSVSVHAIKCLLIHLSGICCFHSADRRPRTLHTQCDFDTDEPKAFSGCLLVTWLKLYMITMTMTLRMRWRWQFYFSLLTPIIWVMKLNALNLSFK